MDDEFTKMLQGCDCHSTEYVTRLRDKEMVCELITKLQSYLEVNGSRSEICRVYLHHIEHLYYKIDTELISDEESKETEADKDSTEVEKTEELAEKQKREGPSSSEKVDKMCKFIYSRDTSDCIRTRAMLCHVYHHALHDRWFEARDLMLMSHLQETIQHSDIPTQILYNRTMVQLGLCAFRHGMIKDTHNALHDVQSSGRAKELLAQGLMQQRQYERTPEQEKIEKRRQVPFHMHINLELLECVYLTSAMLMEIPWMATHAYDYRPRIFSKSFHYQLRQSEKQTLVGPPESMREHVVAASKAMKKGDWKQCKDYILAVKVWKLFRQTEQVQEMLTRKIQEESLRTYLFTYNSVYDSLSLYTLAEMFDLPPSVVHSTISKMIINEELQASWDEPTQTVVMHRGAEPSLLQSLALQLADKKDKFYKICRVFPASKRKEEATTSCNTEKDRDVKQRKNDRSAGILCIMSPCGVRNRCAELFCSESKTQGYAVLHDLIGRNGRLFDNLRYVIYDDGCHLRKFAQNPSRRDLTSAATRLSEISIVVDKMHMKGHVDRWCKENCDARNIEELREVDTEVCEQTFAWLSKYAKMTRKMNREHFVFFTMYLQHLHNLREEQKLKNSGYL